MKVLFACAIAGLALLAGDAQEPASVFVERHAYLMGTRVHLAAWAGTRAYGISRLETALEALETTDAELSTWREDSPISVLNRTPVDAAWQAAAPICDVFATVAEWHTLTGGLFDPAIGSLIRLWDLHGRGRVPPAEELARGMAASGLRHLDFDRRRCTLTRRADVTIDTGAFGKGVALDRAARALGDTTWMIDLGGQVSVAGAPPGLGGWPIAIADPADRTSPHVRLTLRTGSLSTSGGAERDLMVGGRRVGHILDPRTGQPASFRGSVTVWHPRAAVADILSTALFVMGPEQGVAWAASHEVSAAYLIPDEDGGTRMSATAGFAALLRSSE